jgi:deoxyribose-phosphate aldolase
MVEVEQKMMIRFSSKPLHTNNSPRSLTISLRPEHRSDVLAGCELAARYHVATVCVKPCHVSLAKEALKDSDVIVSTVVGFPHGSNHTSIKVAEAQLAMDEGALELDMVLNIGQLRSGKHDFVRDDIKAICDAAPCAASVKVIFENAYLTNEERSLPATQ